MILKKFGGKFLKASTFFIRDEKNEIIGMLGINTDLSVLSEAHSVRILGNPLKGDPFICSGESGAVTTGLLSFIMRSRNLADMRDALTLRDDSVVLLFSIEGDTDPARYRGVVWDGEFTTLDITKAGYARDPKK